MKETDFTYQLRNWVKEHDGGSYKLGASIFLEKGIPDTIYFYKKKTFFLESKVYPRKATLIQEAQVRRIRQWGGYAWIITWKDGIIILEDKQFNCIGEVFNFIYRQIIS